MPWKSLIHLLGKHDCVVVLYLSTQGKQPITVLDLPPFMYWKYQDTEENYTGKEAII